MEKGDGWDVDLVCPPIALAKRMVELSRDITGTRSAVARDLRAGESIMIVDITWMAVFERKLIDKWSSCFVSSVQSVH